VCDHPERHGIDEALVSGTPYRSVAKRFELSESAVYRHKVDHLPAHLLKAKRSFQNQRLMLRSMVWQENWFQMICGK